MVQFLRFVTDLVEVWLEVMMTIVTTYPWLAWTLVVLVVLGIVLELYWQIFASPEERRRDEECRRYVKEHRRKEMSESLRREVDRRRVVYSSLLKPSSRWR